MKFLSSSVSMKLPFYRVVSNGLEWRESHSEDDGNRIEVAYGIVKAYIEKMKFIGCAADAVREK